MLVLTRKVQQQIKIGRNITLTIVRVSGQSVRIGIDAPQEVRIMRSEIAHAPKKVSVNRNEIAQAPRDIPPISDKEDGEPPDEISEASGVARPRRAGLRSAGLRSAGLHNASLHSAGLHNRVAQIAARMPRKAPRQEDPGANPRRRRPDVREAALN